MFRMLDLISWEEGGAGHGPVHLLLISAAELGFAWDGDEEGWMRDHLFLTFGCWLVLLSICFLPFWMLGANVYLLTELAEREGFRRVQFEDFK